MWPNAGCSRPMISKQPDRYNKNISLMRRFQVLVPALLLAVGYWSQAADSNEEKLWRHRNLGKAFYENPTTQVQAVDEFKKALDLAPDSRREQLNYGLALLRGGKTKEGVEQLEQVQKRFPDLPHTYFNLGIVYKKDGDFEKAMPQFERMVKLAPEEPISHYNLGVLLRQANRLQEAVVEFNKSIELNGNLAAPHFQLYNVYRSLQRRDDMARELKLFQDLKKAQEGSATPEDMEWSDYAEIFDPIDAKPEVLAAPVYDRIPLNPAATADRFVQAGLDTIVYSASSARSTRPGISLTGLTGIRDIIAGDFDNDGLADLCALTAKGAVLFQRVAAAGYKRVEIPAAAGDFARAVWVDFDHDYDLDLLLFGATQSKLLRNQGAAGFVDRTAEFPFGKGAPLSAFAYRIQPDTKSFDIVATYADRPALLYRDKLAGKYETSEIGGLPVGSRLTAVADVNRDSYLDLVSSDGVYLNRGARQFEKSAIAYQPDVQIEKQQLLIRRNPTNWLKITLTGVKNLKSSIGAEVEVKAGAHYQKQVYLGTPLLFDLGSRKAAETVRISWANGLIQNETNQAAGKAYVFKEAQRLSGSCPLIWTWNGKGFQFITDVLGVAPLGASSGDGSYFAVDHDEFIQIPGEALRERNGQYEIRITEELSEVAYLDQLRLEAIDHPADEEIYTNEKWKAPPFPQDHLYGVKKRVYPVKARDDKGRDVLASVLKTDQSHPDAFRRTDGGIAEMHALELDFGASVARDNRALLVLHGWVDWADGSTFLAAAQESQAGLVAPYLQVRDAQGQWKTVFEDMGMPDGKPKTIAVDLSGKFLSASREVRIVTNLCVYWDEVFLSERVATPTHRRTAMVNTEASVRFRGFSANKVHPQRKQPEQFFYDDSSPTSLWNPTPGKYTRYGDVQKLVSEVDDRLVVLGSGDEVRLLFEAAKLPRLPSGWRRDFLLKVDGWAKDRDANTAEGQSVEPLPFHGMSSYPYRASEKFPQKAYQDEYNIRPALRLIRPLVSEGSRQ
jgi:Flp pilus assembly protein TadD